MRKVLVVLLILSVMGGAFAQEGSWSVGAKAEIGAIVDFKAKEALKGATTSGTGYHAKEYYDGLMGALSVSYNRGGLNISLGFNQYEQFGYGAEAYVSYAGDFFTFKFGGDIVKFLSSPDIEERDLELWGTFNLFKGIMALEISHFSGNDKTRWTTENFIQGKSEKWSGANLGDDAGGVLGNRSGLITEFNIIDGLNVGFYMPRLFDIGGYDIAGFKGYPENQPAWDLMEDAVKQTIMGVTFSMFDNFGVSAAFDFGKSYFLLTGKVTNLFKLMGVGFFIDANFKSSFTMDIGLSVEFSGNNWGAALGALFYGVGTGDGNLAVKLFPQFYYHIFPNSLAFLLDVQIDLKGNSDIFFAIEPQIFINFKGDGISTNYYWPMNTGLHVRYTWRNTGAWTSWPTNVNALEIIFRWSM